MGRLETKIQNKERRSQMKVCTFEFKVQENKLSKEKIDKLSSLFVLSKNFYNYSLSNFNKLYKEEDKDIIEEEKIDRKKSKKTGNKVYYKIFKSIIKDKTGYYSKMKLLNTEISKFKEIEVLNKDKESEKRDISPLHSLVKQGLLLRMQNSIKGLSMVKGKGFKVGKLKFKSRLESVDLNQYNSTHKIINQDTFEISKIGQLKVSGLNQLSGYTDIEFASAKLIKRSSGYYIHQTCFVNRPNIERKGAVGIDFGIKDQMTLSNGVIFKFQVEESKRLKKLQRQYSRKVRTHKRLGIIKDIVEEDKLEDNLNLQNNDPINKNPENGEKIVKGKKLKRINKIKKAKKKKIKRVNKISSKNGYKLQNKIRKEYEKMKNKRKQIRKNIIHYLNQFETVVIQDENIKAWHSNGGESKGKSFQKGGMSKKVQNSGIGGIIGEIKKLPTHIMTDKFLKSTQDCSCCGSNKLMELKDRIYKCESCGFIGDRDMNSSYNILQAGIGRIIPLLQREINKKVITLNDLLGNKSLKRIIS